jgi:2-methylisocitrate lyase-like PEP mutase family enzyme
MAFPLGAMDRAQLWLAFGMAFSNVADCKPYKHIVGESCHNKLGKNKKMSGAALRSLWSGEDMAVAPGAYDGLTARLVEQAGFKAAYMTGAGTAAARGFPDYGLLTATEMVENAAVMARTLNIPLIADADTGYGNELNVTRTVRDFEAAGVAAIHIEDQVSPKRCGHLDGKEVISKDEFVSKIRAAVAAKKNPDFVVIARTDARATVGFDEAVARSQAAVEAGADMIFLEAVQTAEELAAVPQLIKAPCLLNIVPGGKTPEVSLPEAQALGYKLAILPGVLLRAIIPVIDQTLTSLLETGKPQPTPLNAGVMTAFKRFGANEWDALRRQHDEAAR